MRALVVGAGAVGTAAAAVLAGAEGAEVVLADANAARASAAAEVVGASARGEAFEVVAGSRRLPRAGAGFDAIVVAVPRVVDVAFAGLEVGAHVVSVSASEAEARLLCSLDAEARERGRCVVVGAGFAPGLSCVLALHAASRLDAVDEVHIARAGAGGPACRRERASALGGGGVEWEDGRFLRRRGGLMRCAFPPPLDTKDCFRAATSIALLVAPAFPEARRVSARLASSSLQRGLWRALTAVGLRPPLAGLGGARGEHLGGVWVEVRGRRGAARDVVVLGALDRPGFAAGVVAGVAARWAVSGKLARTGAAGLAELVADPAGFLRELAAAGVRGAAFAGPEHDEGGDP